MTETVEREQEPAGPALLDPPTQPAEVWSPWEPDEFPDFAARPPKAPRPPRPQRPPKPPRRAPRPPRPPAEFTPREQFVRGGVAIVAALLLGFVVNVSVLSHLQHLSAQQQLRDTFRVELAGGTAPVNEGDADEVLLQDGAPVALLEIPSIGVDEIVVEGTDGGSLRSGPGHRRDTVLPGQAGVSVLIGRAWAYGGPFSRLQELAPGQEIRVRTGQGEQLFEVIGLRYAGDASPAPITAGESRLVLQTARGAPYAPIGVAYVDAELVSDMQPSGARFTTFPTLPPSDFALATDVSTVWALVFALQFLVVVEFALVWAVRRVGVRQAWAVFIPVVLLSSMLVSDQVVRLLPNVL